LIAAQARALGVTRVTNNMREFERMPGLNLANWAACGCDLKPKASGLSPNAAGCCG
jgi:hypothetical protein